MYGASALIPFLLVFESAMDDVLYPETQDHIVSTCLPRIPFISQPEGNMNKWVRCAPIVLNLDLNWDPRIRSHGR